MFWFWYFSSRGSRRPDKLMRTLPDRFSYRMPLWQAPARRWRILSDKVVADRRLHQAAAPFSARKER